MGDRQKWFLYRVGKTVFRNMTTCSCPSCTDVYLNGVAIADKDHATHLCDVEAAFTAEGGPTMYFDSRVEALAFELGLELGRLSSEKGLNLVRPSASGIKQEYDGHRG